MKKSIPVLLLSLILGLISATAQTTTTVVNYVGAPITMNVVFGDDNSAHDTLRITGTATGKSAVTIVGLGGKGALTTTGIQIVDTTGATVNSSTSFGAPDTNIGAVSYKIAANSNGWVLYSELRPTAYQLTTRTMQYQAHETLAAVLNNSHSRGGWVQVSGSKGHANSETQTPEYDYTVTGITAGSSIWNNENFNAGLFVGTSKGKSDIGEGGTMTSDDKTLGIYVSKFTPNGSMSFAVAYQAATLKAESYEKFETKGSSFMADLQFGLTSMNSTATDRLEGIFRVRTASMSVDAVQTSIFKLEWETNPSVKAEVGFRGTKIGRRLTYVWQAGVISQFADETSMTATAGGKRVIKSKGPAMGISGSLDLAYAINQRWTLWGRVSGESFGGYLLGGQTGVRFAF